MKRITKLKKADNNLSYKSFLSPNFSERKGQTIKYVIIHYTGMNSLKSCLEKFKDSSSDVSCHWLISQKGKIFKIVDEDKSAWHAGVSCWRNHKMLNKSSIGIELENPGHGKNYRDYSNHLMNSLEKLLRIIITKYNLNIKNILGHSDVSPTRKADPGELFSWQRLAKKNLAYWPSNKIKLKKNIVFSLGDSGKEILFLKKKLKKIGYNCTENNKFDLVTKLTIEAFQRRFLPEQINGIVDDSVCSKIDNIIKNA